MGDFIKKTQDQLGRYVKKPPLSEKNLSRPPFRFLHDIVHNVIDTTGFMSGVFTPEELDAANVTTREAKSAFMQKVVQAIQEKTGDEVPVKISKVLAGVEADKTNSLLQSLAKAIDLHQQEGGAPASSSKKGSGGTKKAGAKTGTKAAANAPGKPDAKRAKPGEKKDAAGTKRGIRDPSPAQSKQPTAKQGKVGEIEPSGSAGKKQKEPPKAENKIINLPPEPPPAEVVEMADIVDDTNQVESRKSSSTRKESAVKKVEPVAEAVPPPPQESEANPNESKGSPSKDVDNVDTGIISTSGYPDLNDDVDDLGDDDVGLNNSVDTKELYDNFAASVVKPNMQTLPPPKTPILSDADAVVATMTGDLLSPKSPLTPIRSPLPINMAARSLTPTLTPTMTPSPVIPVGGSRGSSARPPTGSASQPGRSLSREPSAETNKGSPYNSAVIGEVRPPTSQNRSRPDTGTATGARLSSARPPSARRAPPRPKSSLVKEEVEPYRPTTGKVAHVIMDNTEDGDDDNYIVREVTVSASKPSGLSDLDETPELTLSNGISADSLLPPDQRGLLVNQILETQKELEDKISGKSDEAPKIEQKLNELSLAEVEKLKNLIQVCSRSANPLAKLLDYMAEDVDSMQKEYNNFQEESKRLSIKLENAKEETDKFLQNLKHDLHEIERKIKDKEDAILASQMKIIQQEERIEEIVTGFERVRSGKSAVAEKHMPPADEILQHIQGQSSFNSSATVGIGVGGGGIGVASSFKIPESFMVNSGSVPSSASAGIGEASSPFSRGRVWASGSNNNNNNLSFDKLNLVEDEQPSIQSTSSFSNGFSAQRNVGRSGGGGGGGGSFRRSATEFQIDTDVDNFNPWS